jgi:hypothetical protein
METRKLNFGCEPLNLGSFDLKFDEYCFYMYFPVKFPNSMLKIEKRLMPILPLIQTVMQNEPEIKNKYIYITLKNQFLPKGLAHNRPNWHSDGFGSNDTNYIFYSNTPTEFCIQQYKNISEDDSVSLKQFEGQSSEHSIVTYPNNTLLKLTPENIHRIGFKKEDGVRLFVKISVSDKEYALVGNTHNYDFDYNWSDKIKKRELHRNTP